MIYKKMLEYILTASIQHALVFAILIYLAKLTVTVEIAASVVAAVEAVKFLNIQITIGAKND